MTDCKEYIREVMAITAIPIGNIDASTVGSVANGIGTTVDKGVFTPSPAQGAWNGSVAVAIVSDINEYSGTASGNLLQYGSHTIYYYSYNAGTNTGTITVRGKAAKGVIYKVNINYYQYNGSTWIDLGLTSSVEGNAIYNDAITIGLHPITIGGTLIRIKRDTGKAKDDESDSVAGRGHTVTVNCEVDERGGELWANQLTLERTAHHLVLTFRDGEKGFVAATEDTYLCTINRDGAKVSINFRIHNLMGVQTLA